MINKNIIKVGIIGGLGPLASASFVETIYTNYLQKDSLQKQYHYPYVYLYSEPLLSQSTSIMSVSQSETELLAKLGKNIDQSINQEVDCIIICCFTAHALISKLSPIQQAKIYSLTTQVFEYVLAQNTQFIVLCASSAREAKVLECHSLWPKAANAITFLENEAQKHLNSIIKAVKNNEINSHLLHNFLELISQFPDCEFIIACAELHILNKRLQSYSKAQADKIYDPFYNIMQKIWGE